VKIDSPTFLTETTFISSSVQFSSGSQKFGNTDDDTHIFIGDISGSSRTTGSFGKVESDLYKVGNDNFFIGQTGGAPISDGNLILGSLNTGKQVGFEIHHSVNPVSLRLKYDGGGSELSLDNIHQNYINDIVFKKGGTEYWRIGTGLNTTSDVANNAFLKMANSSYDYMILDDGDDTMFYIDTSTNNVGIGDFTRNRVPGTKLTVDGNISGSAASTGSFGHGFIDGRLGVGTNSPDSKLHIYEGTGTTASSTGTSLFTLTNYVGADLNQQKTFIDFTLLDDNSNETPQVRIGAEVGHNGDANTQQKEGSGAFVVYTNNADTTSGDAGTSLAERMRVDYQGFVGIGTDSPGALLSLGVDLTSTSTPSLIISDNASYRGEFGYSESASTQMWFNNSYDNVASVMQFRMAGSTKMTLKGDGKVGIGTTSPSATLDVVGNVEVSSHITGSGNVKFGTTGTSISRYEFNKTAGGATPFHFLGRDTSNATYPIATFNHSGGTSLWVGTTKISGSSTSTGSFGRVVSADGVFEGAGSKKLIIDSNSNISLGNNDLGSNNTLFGYQAGNTIVAGGNSNTAFGTQALRSAGSADTDGNVAVGFQATKLQDGILLLDIKQEWI